LLPLEQVPQPRTVRLFPALPTSNRPHSGGTHFLTQVLWCANHVENRYSEKTARLAGNRILREANHENSNGLVLPIEMSSCTRGSIPRRRGTSPGTDPRL